jgi:calcineurin-like phosphoesterase family protein
MKIAVYTDPHWSAYSSILRGRGEKYSLRLHNLIKSINWVEEIAASKGCQSIFCLGDFFDKEELSAEELTALQEIEWADMSHVFLVGNHEMARSDLSISSTHLFKLCPRATIVDVPCHYMVENTEICLLPYVLETDRKTIGEYFPGCNHISKKVIFSHNDIKGIQMGKFVSQEGFEIEDIHNNCNLFINGHLHNGSWISEKICNLGNLTGQNFSENALLYPHKLMILDTETLDYEYFDNPHAMHFFKIDLSNYQDTDKDCHDINKIIDSLYENSVVTCKVPIELKTLVEDLIYTQPKILCSRIVLDIPKDSNINITGDSFKTVDHLEQFCNYIKSEVGSTGLIEDELSKVIGEL